MIKMIAIFCIIYNGLFSFCNDTFYQKLEQPTPQWMHDQIQEDLAPFTKELSKQFIDELFCRDEGMCLVRVRIMNGKFHIQKSASAMNHPTPDQIITHLKKLNEIIPIPNIDFLLTAHDGPMTLNSKFILDQLSGGTIFQQFYEPEIQAPIFSITRNGRKNNFIVIPDMFALNGFEPSKSLVLEGNVIYPWESKIDALFSRGSDIGLNDLSSWINHPRTRLVSLSLQYPDLINARYTSLYSQCHKQFAIQQGLMGSYVSIKDHPKYKYLICVDAHFATTPRLPLFLHTNSVVLKSSTPSILWFNKALKPFEHFIPVAEDLSDLVPLIEWAKAHDAQCKQISENARQLAAEILTHEYVYVYLYRLLEAYAKKQRDYYHYYNKKNAVKSNYVR